MQRVKGKVQNIVEVNYQHDDNQEGGNGKSINWKIRYKFDDRGNEIEKINFNSGDQMESKYLAFYDEK